MRIARNRLVLLVVVSCLCVIALFYFFRAGRQDAQSQGGRNPVQTVKTAAAVKKSVSLIVRTNGYVTALNTVDVRPQVQNVVRAVNVKEGQDVRAGDLLFTLDDRNDAANVAKAEAQVARDRADLIDAEATLKRNQELLAKGFVSQAVVDTARSRVNSLRGTVQADVAELEASKVALGYNRITAGISGRLGAITVHPGSLAQPGGTPMVTILQIDPISVTFSVPERDLAAIRASHPNGDAPVTVEPADGKPMTGKLFFIDNTVDPTSGMIRMKAQFANGDRRLWPGQYAEVQIVSRTLPDAVVVPVQAVINGPVDHVVYTVGDDGVAVQQKVGILAIQNDEAALSGLAAGTRVVVEGAQNLRPNSKVKEAQPEPGAKAGKRPA